ncbi:MAG: transcriptional regulator [Bacteroidota bacterium]
MKKIVLDKDITAMYVRATSFPDGIQAAFDQLGKLLPMKSDRQIFGISWLEDGTISYKAAAAEKYEGEATEYGLETFIIKKGDYASQFITDFKKDISAIGTTFQELLKHPFLDPNGYCLEWYKGPDDVLCMVGLDAEKENL